MKSDSVSPLTAAEVNTWIAGKPDREALLLKETGMKPSTLNQIKRGRYVPGERFTTQIRAVMAHYPVRQSGGRAAG